MDWEKLALAFVQAFLGYEGGHTGTITLPAGSGGNVVVNATKDATTGHLTWSVGVVTTGASGGSGNQ